MLAECRAGAYWSCRKKKKPVYLILWIWLVSQMNTLSQIHGMNNFKTAVLNQEYVKETS